MAWTWRLLFAWLFCAWALAIQAQEIAFPGLSGRVVDQAGLLDAATQARLTQMLAAHEQATGEQMVVVTLANLQGRSIEEFGVALGRHWGIGQRGKDNGALLIIAREERQIRIEVGYGLEDRLTDLQSSLIINRIMVPAFQRGDFARGIYEGATAIIQVLGSAPLQESRQANSEEPEDSLPILFFVLLMIIIFMLRGGRGRRGRGAALLAGALLGGLGHGGRGGGFGGFGGGGGGFGGGGASGDW